jgi:hypothetical protein
MKPQAGGQVDPVPTGCVEEGFRKELRDAFGRGEMTAAEWTTRLQAHMDAHMANVAKQDKPYAKRTLVSFTVQHGDVVVMWGDNTQRYMEHAVECKSPMRFAVTLRRVVKDMATKEQWARLDARVESDRAFTPPWARGTKREVGDDGGGEAEGEDEGVGDEGSSKPARGGGGESGARERPPRQQSEPHPALVVFGFRTWSTLSRY